MEKTKKRTVRFDVPFSLEERELFAQKAKSLGLTSAALFRLLVKIAL